MRHVDWVKRLRECVKAHQKVPFEWGKNDCCMFAARCADEITGSGWVADLESHYQDEASAKDYIAVSGGIEAAVTARLGDPVKPALARRGDVCLVETPEGYGLAVCVGADAVIPGAKGLVVKPLQEVIMAWRID